MLLWQVGVTTIPHFFVIATWIWSDEIIYLLVSCNKQLFSYIDWVRLVWCPYTCCKTRREREERGTCKDGKNVMPNEYTRKVAYYNLPRGKWSHLIIFTLRWRKRAGWWQHRPARATLFIKKKSWKRDICFHNNSIVISKYNWEALYKNETMTGTRTLPKESKRMHSTAFVHNFLDAISSTDDRWFKIWNCVKSISKERTDTTFDICIEDYLKTRRLVPSRFRKFSFYFTQQSLIFLARDTQHSAIVNVPLLIFSWRNMCQTDCLNATLGSVFDVSCVSR